jgi:hypothetical protein
MLFDGAHNIDDCVSFQGHDFYSAAAPLYIQLPKLYRVNAVRVWGTDLNDVLVSLGPDSIMPLVRSSPSHRRSANLGS